MSDKDIMIVANKVNYSTFKYRGLSFDFSMTDGQNYGKLCR